MYVLFCWLDFVQFSKLQTVPLYMRKVNHLSQPELHTQKKNKKTSWVKSNTDKHKNTKALCLFKWFKESDVSSKFGKLSKSQSQPIQLIGDLIIFYSSNWQNLYMAHYLRYFGCSCFFSANHFAIHLRPDLISVICHVIDVCFALTPI